METKRNSLSKIKLSSKSLLSREELKNIRGGSVMARCPAYCIIEENGPGIGCPVGQQCVEVACHIDPNHTTQIICV